MGSSVFEMISADEAQELMKVQMEIDPEKLEHYLNLFDQWISTQKYLQELNFSKLTYKSFFYF